MARKKRDPDGDGPDKGFADELEKASSLKPAQAKKPFTWHKTVSGTPPTSNDSGVAKQAQGMRKAPSGPSNFVGEQRGKINKRRGY
jgi:hypothetical protein